MLKRKELYDVFTGIINCDSLSNPESIEFVFRINEIREKIEIEIGKYEKQRPKSSEEYKKYLQKQQLLLDEYAQKDSNGKLITSNAGIAISNIIKYNEELEKLRVEFKNEIEVNNKLNEHFDKFLEEDSNLNFPIIPKRFIPKTITVSQLKGIWNIIEH